MHRLSLVIALSSGCVLLSDDNRPPSISNLRCTADDPQQISCRLDFADEDGDIHDLFWNALDASGRRWLSGPVDFDDAQGRTRGTGAFTVELSSMPAAGTLTVTAHVVDDGEGFSSGSISTTVVIAER